jgi:perosamine synthetase
LPLPPGVDHSVRPGPLRAPPARYLLTLGLMAERSQEADGGRGGKITPDRAIRLEPVPAARVDFSAEDRRWIADRIEEVLASGQLTLGRYGAQLEQEFARYCGLEHGVAVGSGTAALEIILRSLGVAGRDVLIPANTFFATAAAVIHAGGRPVLMDTDPETFGTAPEELERRVTPATAGAIVVHIGGLVSRRMPDLVAAAAHAGIWLVEDAAHAHGSSLGDTRAGAFGIASAFSFYPTKVMTAAEGGMIVTDDERIAVEARRYRDQGKESFERNAHTRLGYNWRLSEPHAIIGLRHFRRLPEMISARQRIAALYDAALVGVDGLRPLAVPRQGTCNYYKYVATLADGLDRRALKTRLRDEYGVALAGEVYEQPIHRQPIFEGYARDPLPMSERVCGGHVCLPVFASMTDDQAARVVEALRDVLD